MGRIFKLSQFHSVVLFSVLITFSMAAISPPAIQAQVDINFDVINFGVKMQKLIDKAWKYYEKSDGDSLLDIILDMKAVVEAYTRKKFDLGNEIDRIEAQLRNKGGKPPKNIFKDFKKFIKKKDKKKHTRALWMESYFLEGLEMSFNDYEQLLLATVSKGQDQEKGQKEFPLKFVVAVSLVLGGAFVMYASTVCPLLAYAGETMMTTGFGMLLDQSLDIYQKDY
jgi:hypothetical protein